MSIPAPRKPPNTPKLNIKPPAQRPGYGQLLARIEKLEKLADEENMRLRTVIEKTAQVLTEDLACRPQDECPDLSAYADGHCDLVALAERWVEARRAK